jgi:hypothetical protein
LTGRWLGIPQQDYATEVTARAVKSGVIQPVIDTLTLSLAAPTLPDRRGFIRTKALQISAAMTDEAANQIADTFLAVHKSTPLKGTLTIQPGGAREIPGDAHIHPSRLSLMAGELVELSHRVDPDTGGQGRRGVIAGGSYDHDTETASVSLDNSRDNLEAILARYGVVTGGQ